MKKTSPDYITIFIITFAVFLGGVVRFIPVLIKDFPLNDGGLFYQMTKDILEHNFSLPHLTSYNGNIIPFGYPPFTFYFMALVQRSLHIGIIEQLHFLPALISTLCIPAFYFLSRSITDSKERSIFAVFAFALMPSSYTWLIMGGGITRSLGMFLGILSLLSVWEMYRKPKFLSLLLSILLCSLTILSHPETAWFVFITSFLIGIRYGLNKKGLKFTAFTILGICLLTSPWWIVIVHRFGISIFMNAAQTGGFFSVFIALYYFTNETFITILAVISLLGLFTELFRHRFFLFIWMVTIFFLSPRSGITYVTIPASMLFGSGVVWVIIPGLVSFTQQIPKDDKLSEILKEKISKLVLGVILIYALFSSMVAPYFGSTDTRAVSQDDRVAMEWVKNNTSVDSQFLVLAASGGWESDSILEWFPALSNRISLSTVQGSEWLPDDQFKTHIERYKQLQSCTNKDWSCVIN